MDVGEAGQPRHLLVEPRIVLHRARAEREQAEVDRIILPAEPGVMAHRLRLGEAGKADRPVAFEPGEAVRAADAASKSTPRRLGIADLEQQRLFEHQPAIAGQGLGAAPRRPSGRVGRPSRFMLMPAPPSSASASASTSSSSDGLGDRDDQPVARAPPRPDRAGRARRRRARRARPCARTTGRASLGRRRVNSLKKAVVDQLDARHTRQPLGRGDRLARG